MERDLTPHVNRWALAVGVLLVVVPFVHLSWRAWLERDYREVYATWLAAPEVRAAQTFEAQPILVVRCVDRTVDVCAGGRSCERALGSFCRWLFESPVQEVCTAKPPAFECHLEEVR